MRGKILEEIYDVCEECKIKEKCIENECILFRIEQIVQNIKSDVNEE